MLKVKLQDDGIRTLHADSDADVLITTTVGIVSEAVYFLVLLMYKAYVHKDIIFIKPGHGKTSNKVSKTCCFCTP